MKTIALLHGDFVPAPGGYLLYEGQQKIHQDLALALQEAYGGDQIHPAWGSLLDSYVGTPLTPEIKQAVLAEINRVISNYITVQNARIVQDNAAGNVSSMTTDDVVGSITSISAQQAYDSLVVTAVLQTLSRQSVNVTQIIS